MCVVNISVKPESDQLAEPYTQSERLELYLYSLRYQVNTPMFGLEAGCFPSEFPPNPYFEAACMSIDRNLASNVGKWDQWYESLSTTPCAFRYSDTVTYEMGNRFLADCRVVEDWGTGAGGFKRFRPDAIGVDGSNTLHAEKKYVDLVTYTTSCDGIFIRHVLEHNYDWAIVLRNALRSARRKLCIVLFTPLTDLVSKEIAHNKTHGVDVPDLSLGWQELEGILREFNLKLIKVVTIESSTVYGLECVIYIEKKD